MAAARLLRAVVGAALGEGAGGPPVGPSAPPPPANRSLLGRSSRRGGQDEGRGGAKYVRVRARRSPRPTRTWWARVLLPLAVRQPAPCPGGAPGGPGPLCRPARGPRGGTAARGAGEATAGSVTQS